MCALTPLYGHRQLGVGHTDTLQIRRRAHIYKYIVVGRVLAARVAIRKEMRFSRTIRALCVCYRRPCCQSTVFLAIAPSAPIQKCIEELGVIGRTLAFTLLYVYCEGGCRPDIGSGHGMSCSVGPKRGLGARGLCRGVLGGERGCSDPQRCCFQKWVKPADLAACVFMYLYSCISEYS